MKMTTREKILVAVMEIYNDLGVQGLTMKKVSEKAGIGKSTVYEYFDSKDQLMSQTIVYASGKLLEKFSNVVRENENQDFEKIVKFTINQFIQEMNGDLGRVIKIMDEYSGSEGNGNLKKILCDELLNFQKEVIESTKYILEIGQWQGIIRKDLIEMDIISYQRVFLALCSQFTGYNKLIMEMADKVENRVDYIYDSLIRLYGVNK